MENFRQMVAQDNGGCPDANLARLAALEVGRDFLEVGEKGLDKLKELFAFRRERERPALKESRAQIFFELGDLRTDGGLLDSVRNVPHRGHDAAVARDVIKKFKMVDVHRAGQCRVKFYQFTPPKQGELNGLHANGICRPIKRAG